MKAFKYVISGIVALFVLTDTAMASRYFYCEPTESNSYFKDFNITWVPAGTSRGKSATNMWIKARYRVGSTDAKYEELSTLAETELALKLYNGEAVSKTLKVAGTDDFEGYNLTLKFNPADNNPSYAKGDKTKRMGNVKIVPLVIENGKVKPAPKDKHVDVDVTCSEPQTLNCQVLAGDSDYKYASIDMFAIGNEDLAFSKEENAELKKAPQSSAYKVEVMMKDLKGKVIENFSSPNNSYNVYASELADLKNDQKASTTLKSRNSSTTSNPYMRVFFNETQGQSNNLMEGVTVGRLELHKNSKTVSKESSQNLTLGCSKESVN